MSLFGPYHDVQSRIIVSAQGICRKWQIHSIPQSFHPALHNLLCKFLVVIVFVQESKEGEQGHLHLLWQREASCVIESHTTAIRYHAVDKLQLFWVESQRTITSIQFAASRFGEIRDLRIKNIVLVNGYDAEAPSGTAEVFRERVHTYRVLWNLCHQGLERWDKSPIHVIGDDDKVGTFVLNQGSESLHRSRAHGHGWRVARVYKEQCLDRRIGELVNLTIRILPGVSAIAWRNFGRVDLNNIKIEPVEMADFDIWSEGRHGKRHLVSPLQQAVHHKGIKDVAHRRGPAFHCKNIKPRRWS